MRKIGFRPSGDQHGVATVELAIILTLLVTLLTAPLFFAMYFWRYSVTQKAAQNAGAYMATIPAVEMKSTEMVEESIEVAHAIIEAEMSDLGLDGRERVIVQCDAICEGAGVVPSSVRVEITYRMSDEFFGMWSTGDFGLRINADIRMPYAGH